MEHTYNLSTGGAEGSGSQIWGTVSKQGGNNKSRIIKVAVKSPHILPITHIPPTCR